MCLCAKPSPYLILSARSRASSSNKYHGFFYWIPDLTSLTCFSCLQPVWQVEWQYVRIVLGSVWSNRHGRLRDRPLLWRHTLHRQDLIWSVQRGDRSGGAQYSDRHPEQEVRRHNGELIRLGGPNTRDRTGGGGCASWVHNTLTIWWR